MLSSLFVEVVMFEEERGSRIILDGCSWNLFFLLPPFDSVAGIGSIVTFALWLYGPTRAGYPGIA